MIPYTNRELSWLEFNQRVIEESKRVEVPLLERVKFLAISGSNLDEFYQVRIGGLSQQLREGIFKKDPSGMTVSEQLFESKLRASKMMEAQYKHWNETLLPELRNNGIELLGLTDLDEEHSEKLKEKAISDILPVLTPIALQYEESSVPISALQICIACELSFDGESRYAIVPIPHNLPRLITIKKSVNRIQFVLIEELITHYLSEIFPNETVTDATVFRATKNSDIVLEDEEARDLAGEMKEILTKRRFGHVVRVETPDCISKTLQEVIANQTGADLADFIPLSGPLSFSDLFSLSITPGFENLKYEHWTPQPSPAFDEDTSIFKTLDDTDIALFHPYESFDPVVRMIEEAAEDPETLAIKQVLYRTASKSRIIDALKKAAINGKQVTILIELKARFDEARNLLRAEELRMAGAQVIYGVKGYKTHAKATLVVRKTPSGIKRYVHLGTGNYNETTATLYTDISYLSSNKDLANDTSLFFNMLTGHSKMTRFRKLIPAPTHMKLQLLELIEGEAERARNGQRAKIMGKMNSLQDPDIIDALYQASKAGVKIRLNVRGICCLQPGIKGLSDNIKVVSIIDRFLEHTRTFSFDQSGEERVYIASADWMVRNLEKRLELMIPIEDQDSKARIIQYLRSCFKDNTNAFKIFSDGSSKRVPKKSTPFSFQKHLYNLALNASKTKAETQALTFQPHVSPNNEA